MNIKAIIWDMGGVLLRTVDGSYREKLAEKLGLPRKELEGIVFSSESSHQAEKGIIDADTHWKFVRDYFKFSENDLVKFIEAFWAGDTMDHQLVTYIDKLRPVYKTGLISNAWSNARSLVDGTHQFLYAFDEVVFSAEVGLRKPGLEIYLLMLHRLGLRGEQCIFIDDFPHNLIGAEKAGFQVLLFTNPTEVTDQLNKILKS